MFHLHVNLVIYRQFVTFQLVSLFLCGTIILCEVLRCMARLVFYYTMEVTVTQASVFTVQIDSFRRESTFLKTRIL